jgi:hypothetical protein
MDLLPMHSRTMTSAISAGTILEASRFGKTLVSNFRTVFPQRSDKIEDDDGLPFWLGTNASIGNIGDILLP